MTKMIALSQNPSTRSHKKKRGVDASILKRGFSLIETVVTLSIIGVLTAVIGIQFGGDSSKATKIFGELATLKKAILRYNADNGKYPRSFINLSVSTDHGHDLDMARYSDSSTWDGPYFEKYRHFSGRPSDMEWAFEQLGFFLEPWSDRILNTPGVEGSGIFLSENLIGYKGVTASGYREMITLEVFNLPRSVAAELMKKCNGEEGALAGDLTSGDCAVMHPQSEEVDGRSLVTYFVGLRR